MAAHRQEIQSSVYSQDQKHSFDEETLETFSYLCVVIEHESNNLMHLVKRLDFIHNFLILRL